MTVRPQRRSCAYSDLAATQRWKVSAATPCFFKMSRRRPMAMGTVTAR